MRSKILKEAKSNRVVGRHVVAVMCIVSFLIFITRGSLLASTALGGVNEATSPDGLRRVWASPGCHCLWGVDRRSQKAEWSEPHKILEIRGAIGKIIFAPDSSRLAFENPRGDLTLKNPKGDNALWGFDPPKEYNWGFIAVYDYRLNKIDYVDPTFGTDSKPVWSPSGHEISFIRHTAGGTDQQLVRNAPTDDGGSKSSDDQSLEAMLAAPVVFQPIASSSGRAIAYAAREGTTRSIYFKREHHAPQLMATYKKDDGEELSELALSPSGDTLAYVRGGRPNKNGYIPNPQSSPVLPHREMWIVGTEGDQTPHLLSLGSQPQFTPDGKSILWLDDQGVMIASIIRKDGRFLDASTPTRMLAGKISNLRIAPATDRIAYRIDGGIAVYDFARDSTWLIGRPSGADDSSPVWSADGKRLVFRRANGSQPKLISDGLLGYDGPFIASAPWSIMVADVDKEETHEVWQAKPGIGSAFYPLDEDPTAVGIQGDQLFWTANDEIVFAWESDGWRHLYAVPSSGGAAKLLTPGAGEVETVSLSLDRRYIFASTNIEDLGRRHLLRVDTSDGKIEKITGGRSNQWGPTPIEYGSLAYVESGWNQPPVIRIREADGATVTSSLPAIPEKFPKERFVEPELIDVTAADGAKAYGQLFRPKHSTGCGVVFAHGGIQRQMLTSFHYMEAYSNLYELNQYLASKGCAVISIEYRSSSMRGYGFRNAVGWGNAGASEMNDVIGAAYALKSDKSLNVQHIGIYGLSWGGYITAQALARHSDLFEAGVDMAGVHEFFGDRAKFGPEAFVNDWKSPVYLIQGDDDRNVDLYQGISLANALSSQPYIKVFTRVVPGETHSLNLTFSHLKSVYTGAAAFLLDHLKGQTSQALGSGKEDSGR